MIIFSAQLAKCSNCVLSFYFVNYAECVICAVCPRYSLHKSNAMLKHCKLSTKVSTQHFTGQKRNIGMNIEDFSFHHSLSFVEIFVESM